MTRYTLGYPNREVETSLNASLLACYTGDAQRSFRHRSNLAQLLLAGNVAPLQSLLMMPGQ